MKNEKCKMKNEKRRMNNERDNRDRFL